MGWPSDFWDTGLTGEVAGVERTGVGWVENGGVGSGVVGATGGGVE